MDNEKFDEYVAARMPVHAVAIRAKLAAGDVAMVTEIEEGMGMLLFDSSQWADLITSTARGRNEFAAVMGRAIESAAEILALKDAEQAERDHQEERFDAALEGAAVRMRSYSGIREHIGA